MIACGCLGCWARPAISCNQNIGGNSLTHQRAIVALKPDGRTSESDMSLTKLCHLLGRSRLMSLQDSTQVLLRTYLRIQRPVCAFLCPSARFCIISDSCPARGTKIDPTHVSPPRMRSSEDAIVQMIQ